MAKYSTNHTEAIVTESQAATERFVALSDCAAEMVNTSTRFTEGEQMGFGVEIGFSNQKLHALVPWDLRQRRRLLHGLLLESVKFEPNLGLSDTALFDPD
jgi:gamma-glutamyl phosphate reductase